MHGERERGGDEEGTLRQAQRGAYPPALPKPALSLSKGGKGAGRVMAVVIFHGKAIFVSGGFSLSPPAPSMGVGGHRTRSVAEW